MPVPWRNGRLLSAVVISLTCQCEAFAFGSRTPRMVLYGVERPRSKAVVGVDTGTVSKQLDEYLELIRTHADRVRSAAASFGPFHEQAANHWLESSLTGGGTCTKALRAALHDHDVLMACVLREDGLVDPRCAAIATALDNLQTRLDELARAGERLSERPGDIVSSTDAREWVEKVLLCKRPTPAQLREQRLVLFDECNLGNADEHSNCEVLHQAIADYFELVARVQ
jgi:hypothetical protein